MIQIEFMREDVPQSFPSKPKGLSDSADAFSPELVWRRIEAYILERWGKRDVNWYLSVEGWCEFVPTLRPATLTEAEQWLPDGSWKTVDLDPSPRGVFVGSGYYKLTYNVGNNAGDVPPALLVAYSRLAEYWADVDSAGGAAQLSDGDFSVTKSPNATARGLYYSGAADVLRTYRKGRK